MSSHSRTFTNNVRLLKHGIAHVSDANMVGAYSSVAGLEVETGLEPYFSGNWVSEYTGGSD